MVVKLLLTLQKNNKELNSEESVDRAMKILKYNCEEHYNFLFLIYKRGGRVIVKDVKHELKISNNAYYKREQRLNEIGLLEVIPKENSRIWTRELALPQLVQQWFQYGKLD